jgi:uncharacterized protein DUF3617
MRAHPFRLVHGAGIAVFGLGIAFAASAAGEKIFRQGLWQIDETIEVFGHPFPKNFTRCMDPNTEIGVFLSPGRAMQFACSWGEPAKDGNRYEIRETCSGLIGGHKYVSLIVESDSAYSYTTDEAIGPVTSKAMRTARRIGDC